MLESLVLESLVLGSLVLGSLVLGSLVLGWSLVLTGLSKQTPRWNHPRPMNRHADMQLARLRLTSFLDQPLPSLRPSFVEVGYVRPC